jgi:hypothetical protein
MVARAEESLQEAFGSALEQLWARDGIDVDAPRALADRVAALFERGDEGTRAASELLARSGVRAQWNGILRRDRAAALAARIHPFVDGPLLDLLAGDGSVCSALADLGVASIAATERAGEYPQSRLPAAIRFLPFADDLDLRQFDATTALVSTVLHHEADPIRLLDQLAKTSIPRWIVVENCVTPEFSRPFHELADRFFNNCLNDFGVDCVDQHRTLDEWVDELSRYGAVTVVDEFFSVPGIPFPYSLLVVSRDVGATTP